MKTPRALPTIAAGLLLALTACGQAATDNPPEAAEPATTPTQINRPDDRDICTVDVNRGAGEGEYPDQATIECGDITRTVSGDFSEKTSNHYGPTAGVKALNVVNGEARAWLRDDDGDTCLVIYRENDPPTRCVKTETGKPAPDDEHTVTPRADIPPEA